MALRFRKRIRLLPGVNINLGAKGVSVSAGIRGASLTAGSRGLFGNVGIPGTGISFRKRINRASPALKSLPASTLSEPDVRQQFNLTLRLQDTGEVVIENADGSALTPSQTKLLRDQKGEAVREWLAASVEGLNADYVACINVHLKTPAPFDHWWLTFPDFDEPRPAPPQTNYAGLMDRMLLRGRSIEADNEIQRTAYENALAAWEARARTHLETINYWRAIIHRSANGDIPAMDAMLNELLGSLPWPRSTTVSYDFSEDSAAVALDIDLPEIEDMPRRVATVAARGFRVNFKDRTDAQVRADYVRLVHGAAFRLAGEIFANLTSVDSVTLAGFTQRNDPQTGRDRNDYVLSVRLHRSDWAQLNFDNLEEIDPVAAMGRFEVVRNLDRAGSLLAITPL